MAASVPLQLAPDDKLDLLRYLDEFHYWHSLDDERRCKRCGRSITGRQVMVVGLHGQRGKMRLQCPTAGCVSSPSEWVYANPVLAAKRGADLASDKTKTPAALLTHDGYSRTGRGVKSAGTKYAAAAGKIDRRVVSFRAIVARLKLLRPLVSGLHSIRPVA